MRFLSCATFALAMTCSYASVYANGTILLTRPVNTVSNGTLMPTGSGLFTVNDQGGHLRQLTPFVSGSYYMPSWVALQNYSTGVGYWMTTNFSPDGQSVLYFQNPSSDPADGPYSGKYYMKNLSTGAIQPLFAGSNDNAAPGYGYLARDPIDGNTIAYTNSTSEYPVASPCVYLMHADGSNQHIFWCAPPTISVPNAETPPASLAVESLRWSGNGQKLMAYVSFSPPPLGLVAKKDAQGPYHAHSSMLALMQRKAAMNTAVAAAGPVRGGTGYSALFVIDVATGTAVEVGANMFDPPSGDISYDGTKVIYEQYDYAQCGDEDTEALGTSLCFKDLTTGTVTDLFQPVVWNYYGSGEDWLASYPSVYHEILLSPDGTQAVFTLLATTGNEADLYTIRTDGTNLRHLTFNPNPPTIPTAWTPVAWSPDGTRILANRSTAPVAGSEDQTTPSEVHILKVSNGNDTFVTDGYAVDWLEQP
jgi:hypothetical protein